VAQVGSLAEKLFRTGDAGTAPTGRFDDYAVPPLEQP
jgi:hypothetical protein